MNWGKGIVLAFIGFALFIGVLVTICVKQDIHLVSKNYYLEELNYQEQIDQLGNTANLPDKPRIVVTGKEIDLVLPVKPEHGSLKLIRPSNAKFDALFDLDSITHFDLSKYPSGRYNVSLQWESRGKKYLMQQPIRL